MPQGNWLRYLISSNPVVAVDPAAPVAERIDAPPVEGAMPPEVTPNTTITFDDTVPEGSLRGVEYPSYTFYSGPQWVTSDWNSASPWGASDPLAQPQQRKGPSMEAIDKWYREGQHSRIPTCCIEWFCTRWARATNASNKRYTRLLKKMHEDCKYLWQPGFVPCPKTIRAKDIVYLHHCDYRCQKTATATDIRAAKEHLMRSMYGGVAGRLENIVINESGPTIRREGVTRPPELRDLGNAVRELQNQREDNIRLARGLWSPDPI